MYKDLDIFYFSSTHWDREWYQTFQGFRFRLAEMTDKLLDLFDNDPEYQTFHFDGQTIVLEDYAEVRPEKIEKLKELIKQKKILVGPWYVMPDEFIVSGESLIKNLAIGHQLSKDWGGEPWKYGYICDIFGHIAQMPQIFKGFDINYSLLGRGTTETMPAYFNWKSPDGSSVTNFMLNPTNGYGTFKSDVYAAEEDKTINNPKIIENIKFTVDREIKRMGDIPVVILMDGLDHADAAVDTTDYIKKIAELYPGARVHHVNLCEQGKLVEKYDLPTIEGELCKTAKGRYGYLHLITNTLSSYYTIKKENDECQTIMEKWFEPMGVFGDYDNIDINKNYVNLAYKTLITNHPHDSICGCSIDRVHQDMEYRYAQIKEIYTAVSDKYTASLIRKPYNDDDYAHILTLVNPLPFEINKTITVDVDFEAGYKTQYAEPFGYEPINAFKVYDKDGNEIPYQVVEIKRNYLKRIFDQVDGRFDVHTITLKVKIPPCGRSEYKIMPWTKDPAVRYLKKLTSGQNFMENDFVKVTILGNGSIEMLDKKTGKVYSQLGNLVDDGEIGDGWYHANPVDDCVVSTICNGAKVEKIENGPSRCVFRVTRTVDLPKDLVIDTFGKRRNDETVSVKFVTKIGLSEEARYADVELDFDNIAKDHRLRFMMPTGIADDTYFSGQAFCCLQRKTGIDYTTQYHREHDQWEKSTNGIVGKRDKKGNGIAFVSAFGLHECAGFDDEDGTIAITLLRSFKNTVKTNGGVRCQLNLPLNYKFALVPLDKNVKYSDLLKLQDEMSTGFKKVISKVQQDENVAPEVSFLKVTGDDIATSIIKRAQDGSGDIVVRVFNASDKASKATVQIMGDISKAVLTNLNEEFVSDLTPDGNKVSFEVTPWQIKTVKISK